jgi:hypothetical protein
MMNVEEEVEWELPRESEVLGKYLPSASLSTTNPTWIDLGSNPIRRGGKPATNHLSYSTTFKNQCNYSTHKVFSVVTSRCLVMASNGACFPSPGFPASATCFSLFTTEHLKWRTFCLPPVSLGAKSLETDDNIFLVKKLNEWSKRSQGNSNSVLIWCEFELTGVWCGSLTALWTR